MRIPELQISGRPVIPFGVRCLRARCLFAAGVAVLLFAGALQAQEQPLPISDPDAEVEEAPVPEPGQTPGPQLDPTTDLQPETPLQELPQAPEFNPDVPGLLAPPPPEIRPSPAETPPEIVPELPTQAAAQTPALQPRSDVALRPDPSQRAATGASSLTGESLTDGVGRTPDPMGGGFLATNAAYTAGIPFGPVTLRPFIGVGINYNSLRTDEGRENDTEEDQAYAVVFGSIEAVLGEPATGNIITARYSGSLSVGDDRADPYNQALTIQGSLTFTKLKLGLGIQFSQLTGTNRDFGEETNRELFTLSLTSSYQYSEKTWLDWDINMPVRHFESGQSSVEFMSTNTINYAYSPKTIVGAGFSLGTLALDKGNTQKIGQIFTRAQFAPSEFISLDGNLGVEVRDTGDHQRSAPVFGTGVTWRPRLGTTVSLKGERRILNSAAEENTNYASTSGVLSLEQRIGATVTMRGSLGVEDARYESNEDGVSTSRHDIFYLSQVGFSAQINSRWVAGMLVSYGYNDSSDNSIRLFQSSLLFTYLF